MARQSTPYEPKDLPDDPLFGPVIYAYSRAEAIADGVLVDVTEMAKEVGFKLARGHHRSALQPAYPDQGFGQDYNARPWDLLWIAAFTIKLADPGTDTVSFTVALRQADVKSRQPRNSDLHLRAVCGPGHKGVSFVTIGFPRDFQARRSHGKLRFRLCPLDAPAGG
jgi:hypothetical protein